MQKVSIWWLFLVLFGLTIGGIQTLDYWARPASAQSPTSYPWCSRLGDNTNVNNCYYTSKEQCQRTISGNGGFCIRNPSYRGLPDRRSGR